MKCDSVIMLCNEIKCTVIMSRNVKSNVIKSNATYVAGQMVYVKSNAILFCKRYQKRNVIKSNLY
jgi:hypothetical protein